MTSKPLMWQQYTLYEHNILCVLLCSMNRALYNMATTIQQDATIYSLFKSVNCSTCFGWYFTHHQELITLSTASDIIETCTDTCHERPVTFTTGISNGLNNARYCRYSDMSCWWVETVEYRGGLGGSKPPKPPGNSEGPPKSCQTQPDCENC